MDGENALAKRVSEIFSGVKWRNVSVQDARCSCRQDEIDSGTNTSRTSGMTLDIHQILTSSVENRLHELGYANNLDV